MFDSADLSEIILEPSLSINLKYNDESSPIKYIKLKEKNKSFNNLEYTSLNVKYLNKLIISITDPTKNELITSGNSTLHFQS